MIEKDFLEKIKKIEIQSRRIVKEGLTGQYNSKFKGSGMQFSEFRPYVYGDDVRHISWNVSARTDHPVIKLFEEERDRTLFLVVDISNSLRKGIWAEKKSEKLAEIAGTLAMSAFAAKDKFGLLLFSDQVECVIPPARGKTHLLRVIREILYRKPEGKGTDPDDALKRVLRVLKKQTIVFYLSDFEIMPDTNILKQIASKHEFAAIGIDDNIEADLPNLSFIEIESAEKGRPATIDTSSKNFISYLKTAMNEKFFKAQSLLLKAGLPTMWFHTDEDFIPELQNYFKSKGRR